MTLAPQASPREPAIVRVADFVIVNGLGLLGVVIALSVSQRSYNPLLIKTALLDAGTALLACAWIVKTLERRRLSIGKPLLRSLIPACFFLLSAAVSYLIVTPSKDTSFDELVCRIPYFVLMTIAALEFRDLRTARRLMLWIMAAAYAFSLYGLAQHFEIMPINDNRIFSTFGNPNFYVGFLIPVIGVTLAFFDFGDGKELSKLLPCLGAAIVSPVVYYATTYVVTAPLARGAVFTALAVLTLAMCRARRIGPKTVTVSLLFLLVSNILLTSSRSGQIGLAAMLVIFAVLIAAFVMQARRFKKALFVGGLAALSIGLMLTGVLHITKSRTDATIERKFFALGAVDLIKRKPLLGHGLGTFKNNYPLVKRAESWKYNLVCFEFTSNVYNEFLEICHDEGIAGLAVFLWLLAAVFGSGIAAVKREQASPRGPPDDARAARRPWHNAIYSPTPAVMLIGLMSGAGALLLSNVFSLSMRYSATGFVFWTFLGLIVARTSPVDAASPDDRVASVNGHDKRRQVKHTAPGVRLPQAAVVLIVAVFIHAAWRYYRAEISMYSAVEHSKDAYRTANESGEVFHDIYIEGTTYTSDPAEWNLAIRDYLTTLRDNPHYLRARYFLANAFNRRWNLQPACDPRWGDRNGRERTDAQRALEQYEYVGQQAPGYIEIDYEMGDLYQKTGDIDKAIACYGEYKRQRPFFTKIHTALAQAYSAKHDWTNAAEAYKDALDLNKRFVLGYCELSFVYFKMGDTALSQEAFERAVDVSPKGANRLMARVYADHSVWDKAAAFAQEVAKIDSSDAQGYRDLGWYRIQEKAWAPAIAAYEHAVRIDSADVPSLITLSNLYFQEKRLDESKAAFRTATALDPAAVQRIIARSGP